jgi:hypothetical protein
MVRHSRGLFERAAVLEIVRDPDRSSGPPERAGRLLAAFPDAAVLVTRPDGSRHELSEGGKF